MMAREDPLSSEMENSQASASSMARTVLEAAGRADEEALRAVVFDLRDLQMLPIVRRLVLEDIVSSPENRRPHVYSLYLLHCHGFLWFPILLESLVKQSNNHPIFSTFSTELMDLLKAGEHLRSLRCFTFLIRCAFASRDQLTSSSSITLFDNFFAVYTTVEDEIINIFRLVNRDSNLDSETLRRCRMRCINSFVSDDRDKIPLLDCVGFLGRWRRFETHCRGRLAVVVELLVPFGLHDIRSMLQRLLKRDGELNYKHFLALVQMLLQHMQGTEEIIFDLTNNLIVQSLDDWDQSAFLQAMLIVRLACLEKGTVFTSYSDWFQRAFGIESSSLAGKNRKYVQFLKFLTQLVPYELMGTLMNHLSKPPYIPLVYRQDWSDYCALARTRLVDLEQREFENSSPEFAEPNFATGMAKDVEEDVVNSVKEFKETGKIPQKVLESSIFRKPYFLGHFVPCLLSLNTADVQAKTNLLQELIKRGKIPKQKLTIQM